MLKYFANQSCCVTVLIMLLIVSKGVVYAKKHLYSINLLNEKYVSV